MNKEGMECWKKIRERVSCKCGNEIFKKTITEFVKVIDVRNFNKEGKFTGGIWDEEQQEEHLVSYLCTKCGVELKWTKNNLMKS